MHVISRKRLREFWERHPEAREELEAWFRTARRAEWRNIVEVREVYPHADAVGTCTVFNVRGNHFRLIAKVQYRIQRVYVKHVLTHAEYDRERWKNDCGS